MNIVYITPEDVTVFDTRRKWPDQIEYVLYSEAQAIIQDLQARFDDETESHERCNASFFEVVNQRDEAQKRMEVLRVCAGYAQHRGMCQMVSTDYESYPLGTRKCTCGLVEAFAALRVYP